MADQTNNPGAGAGPAATPGAAPQAGPARSGPGITADPRVQAQVDAFAAMHASLKGVAQLVDVLNEKVAKLGKTGTDNTTNFREWGTELRQAIEYTDEVQERFKLLADYQRRMQTHSLKAKDYKEVLTILEEMRKQNDFLVRKGIFSDRYEAQVRKQMHAIQETAKQFERMQKGGEKFNRDVADRMLQPLLRVAKTSSDLTKNLHGIRLTGLRKDAESLQRSFRHVFQMSDRSQKYREYGTIAAQLRDARQARMAGRVKEFEDKKAEITQTLARTRFRDVNGFRKTTALDLRDKAASLAKEKGMGVGGQYIMGRAALERAQGKEPGVITRTGMNLLARGEGSITRGIASMGVNSLEGGALNFASLAGRMAPVLGALEVVKYLFDKNQTMNADVANKLGSSGIYNPGGANAPTSPLWAIRNVRENLNAPGIYNPLGIGYEKNLAIAESLSNAGFSNQNLGMTNLGRDEHGFVNGSFGTYQRNAYTFGRMAGLDSTQTTNETIKLISQYRQSLGSTEDFFLRINKDTHTAAITTQKYIEVLDDVNSHYERSNRLLEATVDTMRLLSVTGRNTADTLKEDLETLTNGGKTDSLEMSAFFGMKGMQDPETAQMMSQGLNRNYALSLQNLSKAFPEGVHSEDDLRNILGRGDAGREQLINEAQGRFGTDKQALQAANEAIKQAFDAFTAQNSFKQAQQMGGMRGGLAWASYKEMAGPNILTQEQDTFTKFLTALKMTGHTLDQFASGSPEERAKVMGDFKLNQVLRAFNLEPQKINRLYDMRTDAAAARVQIAQEGMRKQDNLNTPEGQDRLRIMNETFDYMQSRVNGKLKQEKGETKAQALQRFSKSDQGSRLMMEVLPQWAQSLRDVFGSTAIAEQMRPKIEEADKTKAITQAVQLTASTRTTAEIYASAFEYLFNKIQTPLDYISNLLGKIGNSRLFGVHADTASQKSLEDLNSVMASGMPDTAMQSWQSQVDVLRAKLQNETDDKKKDDLNKQIKGLEWNLNLGNKVQTAAQNGQTQYLGQGDVDMFLNKVKYDQSLAMKPEDIHQLFDSANHSTYMEQAGKAGIFGAKNSNMTDSQFQEFARKAMQLNASGFSVDERRDKSGQVQEVHIVNNTYNGVNYQAAPGAKQALNKANETAPSKSKDQVHQ